ncbi:MAG: molybdopterin-dependent oxidoreductase [Coriobacteriia bacterium]
MTNNWVDIDNASLVYVQGANPSENHPACMGHVNAARFGDKTVPGYPTKKGANLIVVDPRITRTARQIDPSKGDKYIRIRPGTDIAFINSVLNQIFARMYEARANPLDADYATAVNFFAWHNSTAPKSTASRAFIADNGTTQTRAGWPKYCDSRNLVDASGTDYQRETWMYDATGSISNMPKLAATVEDLDCVFQKLKLHVSKYPSTVAANICGCTTADIDYVADKFIKHSRFASADFGVYGDGSGSNLADPGYRATTILYAMGITQHTCGSQNIRDYGVIQTLMGNMGRAGGGINALRGIHNVQGSTDMANLYDGIPGYSANPTGTYADYVNGLFGNRVVNGTSPVTSGAKNPYVPGDLGLQQRGFYNMTREWFGKRGDDASGQANVDAMYDLWPKGNGVQHIMAFRRMLATEPDATRIKALVNWGQNPAITEPNQGKIRQAMYDLDLLVCVDMFANESAQVHRKDGAPTYLFPACSHVEEGGSVTSSGRWIQWRDRAAAPKGYSKADLELLLMFAKALNGAGAFTHIKSKWATMTGAPALYADGAGADPYTVLYQKYGWDGVSDFESLSGDDAEGNTLYGSEYVAEEVFKEICSPLNATGTSHQGTMWIYSGNGTQSAYCTTKPNDFPAMTVDGSGVFWPTANRARSRLGHAKYAGIARQYSRYGWAWLLNRRIFYNNSELDGDVGDVFVAPGYMSRLFTINTNTMADYSTLYRKFNTLADKPDAGIGGVHVLPGRFPAHTEPYESPRPDLVATWGRNTSGGTSLNLYPGDQALGVYTPDTRVAGQENKFDLVLTTIRCVEHFQGGPTTRNNPWNHELEPEPWVEINSVDAIKYGIADGDYVNVITARGDSTESQMALNKVDADAADFAKGFKARVGVGTSNSQRVAPGVVAIPWHWGERGLSKGSRANDLCIDAWDANTTIPESKACLCRIRKVGI